MFFSISANLCDKVSISWLIFWAVIFAYSWVVFILVCPNRRLTVSIGTPLDKRTVVAFVCLATCVLNRVLKPHCLPISFSILLQVVLLGMGNTLLSLVKPLYLSIIFRGTSNRRILDSVLVFFLRVIIHRLPSKKV